LEEEEGMMLGFENLAENNTKLDLRISLRYGGQNTGKYI
jgi:hypothetical protein